jgi:hypothetical protein
VLSAASLIVWFGYVARASEGFSVVTPLGWIVLFGAPVVAYLSIMAVRALVLWVAAGFRKEGMTDPMDELQSLYSAIGYVMVKWSFIDQALDSATNTIYRRCGGHELRKQMPKFLTEKTAFIAKAAAELPQLSRFKTAANKVTGTAARIKDYREDFAHSTLTSVAHVDGVYSFARLDAKQHEHELIEWTFDVRNFPKMADDLERLAKDAQQLAKALSDVFGEAET